MDIKKIWADGVFANVTGGVIVYLITGGGITSLIAWWQWKCIVDAAAVAFQTLSSLFWYRAGQ